MLHRNVVQSDIMPWYQIREMHDLIGTGAIHIYIGCMRHLIVWCCGELWQKVMMICSISHEINICHASFEVSWHSLVVYHQQPALNVLLLKIHTSCFSHNSLLCSSSAVAVEAWYFWLGGGKGGMNDVCMCRSRGMTVSSYVCLSLVALRFLGLTHVGVEIYWFFEWTMPIFFRSIQKQRQI